MNHMAAQIGQQVATVFGLIWRKDFISYPSESYI